MEGRDGGIGGGPDPLPRRSLAGAGLLLAVAVLLAFGGALGNGFVRFDDDRYITGNPRVLSLSAENLRWMWTDTATFYWHPLTWMTHAAEVGLFGLDPRWHHATSLLLHAANAFLVLLLFLALARESGVRARPRLLLLAGLAAAGTWALHPLRVESVAWASGKKDLLSTLLFLGSLLAWLRYGSGSGGGARGRWYGASLLLLVLALLAKPMAMTLPAVLLVLDAWPLRRFRKPGAAPRLLLEKVPFLLVAAAAVLPSLLDPRQETLLPGAAAGGAGERAVMALHGLAFGLERTLVPAGLVPFYPLPLEGTVSLAAPRYAGAALLLAAATGAAVLAFRRGRRAAPVAWGLFLLLALPVSGIRQAGSVETADRFTFLPSVALHLLAGAGVLAWSLRARSPAAPAAAAAVLAAALGCLAARQVGVWRDTPTLWTAVAEAHPGRVPIAHGNLGAWHHQRALETGDAALLERAEREYRTALALRPDHETALGNLALLLLDRGEAAEAEALLRRALEVRPRFTMARANLARLLVQEGRFEEARAESRRAREGPGDPPPAFLDVIDEAVERATSSPGGKPRR